MTVDQAIAIRVRLDTAQMALTAAQDILKGDDSEEAAVTFELIKACRMVLVLAVPRISASDPSTPSADPSP